MRNSDCFYNCVDFSSKCCTVTSYVASFLFSLPILVIFIIGCLSFVSASSFHSEDSCLYFCVMNNLFLNVSTLQQVPDGDCYAAYHALSFRRFIVSEV
jgi:hypothetical protein